MVPSPIVPSLAMTPLLRPPLIGQLLNGHSNLWVSFSDETFSHVSTASGECTTMQLVVCSFFQTARLITYQSLIASGLRHPGLHETSSELLGLPTCRRRMTPSVTCFT